MTAPAAPLPGEIEAVDHAISVLWRKIEAAQRAAVNEEARLYRDPNNRRYTPLPEEVERGAAADALRLAITTAFASASERHSREIAAARQAQREADVERLYRNKWALSGAWLTGEPLEGA